MDETMFDGLGDEDFDLPSFLERLGLPYHLDQNGAVSAPCSQHPDDEMSVSFTEGSDRFRCSVCGHAGSLQQYARSFTQLIGGQEYLPVVSTVLTPARQSEGAIIKVVEEPPLEASFQEVQQGSGRAIVLIPLALLAILAGFTASVLSAAANYRAFFDMAADPSWGRVWGGLGIVASVVVFISYSIAYWHVDERRIREAIRVGMIALIASIMSIIGTNIAVGDGDRSRSLSLTAAADVKNLQDQQIADWQSQLATIDPSTRSVDAISVYLSEVERVGRTHERPYRLALAELEEAKRRDKLVSSIEGLRSKQLAAAEKPKDTPLGVPSLVIALLLELLASQTGAIGIVVLIHLSNRN